MAQDATTAGLEALGVEDEKVKNVAGIATGFGVGAATDIGVTTALKTGSAALGAKAGLASLAPMAAAGLAGAAAGEYAVKPLASIEYKFPWEKKAKSTIDRTAEVVGMTPVGMAVNALTTGDAFAGFRSLSEKPKGVAGGDPTINARNAAEEAEEEAEKKRKEQERQARIQARAAQIRKERGLSEMKELNPIVHKFLEEKYQNNLNEFVGPLIRQILRGTERAASNIVDDALKAAAKDTETAIQTTGIVGDSAQAVKAVDDAAILAKNAAETTDSAMNTATALQTVDDAAEIIDDTLRVTDDAKQAAKTKELEVVDDAAKQRKAIQVSDDAARASRVVDDAVKGSALKVIDDAAKVSDDALKVTDDAAKVTDDALKVTDDAAKVTDDAVKTPKKGGGVRRFGQFLRQGMRYFPGGKDSYLPGYSMPDNSSFSNNINVGLRQKGLGQYSVASMIA